MEEDKYKTEFLRLSEERHRKRYNALRGDSEGLIVSDTIQLQLEDYIKSVNPTRRMNKTEMEHEIKRHLDGQSLEEYGVWVHYPWSNRLVHVLDEEEFITVRTNRNNYKITHAEQRTLAGKRIGLIGLSVGHAVAHALALERSFGELVIADFDELDLSNLNRIRSTVHNIGVPKTVMVAREIAELDPYLKVTCYHDGVTSENIDSFFSHGGGLDLVIDECDSLDVKIAIREKAKMLGIPVVMETSDRGMLDIERFDLDKNLPILHGLAEGLDSAMLKDLTNAEKIPFVMKIVEFEKASPRAKLSLSEVGKTISTWPQLGGDVTMGGGVVANAVRRLLLGQEYMESNRYCIDLNKLVGSAATSEIAEDIDHLALISRAEHMLSQSQQTAQAINQASIVGLIQISEYQNRTTRAIPWIWHQIGNTLILFSDLRSCDVQERKERLLFAGGAIKNVELAASHSGLIAETDILEADLMEDLPMVARIDLMKGTHVEEEKLVDYIKGLVESRNDSVSELHDLSNHLEIKRDAEGELARIKICDQSEEIQDRISTLVGEKGMSIKEEKGTYDKLLSYSLRGRDLKTYVEAGRDFRLKELKLRSLGIENQPMMIGEKVVTGAEGHLLSSTHALSSSETDKLRELMGLNGDFQLISGLRAITQ